MNPQSGSPLIGPQVSGVRNPCRVPPLRCCARGAPFENDVPGTQPRCSQTVRRHQPFQTPPDPSCCLTASQRTRRSMSVPEWDKGEAIRPERACQDRLSTLDARTGGALYISGNFPQSYWEFPRRALHASKATAKSIVKTVIAIPQTSFGDSNRNSTTCSPAGISTARSKPNAVAIGTGSPST